MPTLDWLGREAHLRAAEAVPYRLLTQDDTLGVAAEDAADNLLVQGDNLEAPKALLPFYAGQVKCIYIGPPFNTQSGFEHYDDSVEHTPWLGMIGPRLMLLREFLSEDGPIWVSIDDPVSHYLKVLMDEIFGRRSLIGNVVWQKRTSPDGRIHLGDAQENIMVCGSRGARENFNLMGLTAKQKVSCKNSDNDPRVPWVWPITKCVCRSH